MIHPLQPNDPKDAKNSRAAILCGHVATGRFPILYAARDTPLEEVDSGWQFVCNKHEEDLSEAKVCSVLEVLEIEPSLAPFIHLPPGTKIIRDSAELPWKVWIPPEQADSAKVSK
jgi:hypothetical protein